MTAEPPDSTVELPDGTEIIGRFFQRRRSRLVVEIDLDPISGWGNHPDDHCGLVQRFLNEAVPHYNPTVEIDETGGRRVMNLLDTYQCPGCGDDHTETARCDHTDSHCPDCADEGFCRLCVRERGDA